MASQADRGEARHAPKVHLFCFYIEVKELQSTYPSKINH